MAEYGNGERVTQSPPLQTVVDTYRTILKMYRNLKGTVYRSPVQKDIKPTFFESNCSLREPDMNMQRYVTSNFIWHCLPLCGMLHTVGCNT